MGTGALVALCYTSLASTYCMHHILCMQCDCEISDMDEEMSSTLWDAGTSSSSVWT